jgi:hypothetical protein
MLRPAVIDLRRKKSPADGAGGETQLGNIGKNQAFHNQCLIPNPMLMYTEVLLGMVYWIVGMLLVHPRYQLHSAILRGHSVHGPHPTKTSCSRHAVPKRSEAIAKSSSAKPIKQLATTTGKITPNLLT